MLIIGHWGVWFRKRHRMLLESYELDTNLLSSRRTPHRNEQIGGKWSS